MTRYAAILAVFFAATPCLAADSVATDLDNARAAYQKGDIAAAARAAETALVELHRRLGKHLAAAMPSPRPGWQAEEPESQSLTLVGGGLSVSRAYLHNDSSLNATVTVDNPVPHGAAGGSPLKINGEDAFLRWNAANKTGAITIALGERVLLLIEGDNIGASDILVDSAKGWNIAAIKKLVFTSN